MELIRIPGYTEDEKVEIARRHLIPKQIPAHGLKKAEWAITDDALHDLIRYYTREAGVRKSRARDREPDAQGDQGHLDAAPQEGDRDAAQSRALCRGAPVPFRRGRAPRISSA